jgi:hypothetical protein
LTNKDIKGIEEDKGRNNMKMIVIVISEGKIIANYMEERSNLTHHTNILDGRVIG